MMKKSNLHVIQVIEGKDLDWGRAIFGEIVAGNFPNLTKDTKPLIQENHTNSKSEGKRQKKKKKKFKAVRGIKVINTSLLRRNSHNKINNFKVDGVV